MNLLGYQIFMGLVRDLSNRTGPITVVLQRIVLVPKKTMHTFVLSHMMNRMRLNIWLYHVRRKTTVDSFTKSTYT
jgi:hypothetical protein